MVCTARCDIAHDGAGRAESMTASYEGRIGAVRVEASDALMSDAGIDGDGDFVGSMDEPKPFVLQLRVRKVL